MVFPLSFFCIGCVLWCIKVLVYNKDTKEVYGKVYKEVRRVGFKILTKREYEDD